MHAAIGNQVVYAAAIGGGGHGAVACGTNRTLHVAAFFFSVRKVNRSLGMVEPIVACGCEVGSVMQVVCVSRAPASRRPTDACSRKRRGPRKFCLLFLPKKT
jgi:hypothetical protein